MYKNKFYNLKNFFSLFELIIKYLKWRYFDRLDNYNETSELSWYIELNLTEPNRIFPIFRCFLSSVVKIIQKHQIHNVKSFKCDNKTEFGSIEPNSKNHRNIEKVRVPWTYVRFDSVSEKSSRVSMYLIYIKKFSNNVQRGMFYEYE